ncbi:MAG: hypothetical protein P8P46_08515 [Alphaproteobacteria bacterium]|nr:hypothetical protein [Alphaproteobacteria bacterium]
MKANNDKGIAMLLALFALAIISTLALTITGKGQDALNKNQVAIKRAQNLALVEGAIQAIYPILLGKNRDQILKDNNGRIQQEVNGVKIIVEVNDACGKWDLNHGHLNTLDALLARLVPTETKVFRKELIQARNNGIGFQHISQILSLPGASKGRLSELIGEVTVYCYVPQVDPLQSSDYMKNLLRSLPSYSSGPGPGRAFKLKATNNLGAGSNITIDAYLGITDDELNPIKILNWQSNY